MANHIKLQPLSKESARGAIMGPVKVYNKKRKEAPEVKIDDELVDTILEAVNSSQIEMPYMELILEHLWDNRVKQGNATASSLSLEKKDLDDIGGAEGLLKQHLKQQLAHIRPKQQETAREMFRYLVTPSSRNTIPQTAEDLAEFIIAQSLEKRNVQVAEINKLLKTFSKPDVRLLKRLTENRYEVYFPRLARVIADRLKSERRIQRLNDEGEAALREFEYSQLYALERVYSALKDYQSELETKDVEERKAFPYPSAMMISQALVWMLSEIRERKIYCHEKGAIFGVSFSPDGLLATCSLDGTLAIWDVTLLDEGASMAVQSGDGFDLRLMSSLYDVSGMPTEGKNLIVVVAVNNALHFRIFDGDGKVVVDTDEKKLTEQARQIEDLKKQLESLWPPHELTRSDKGWVITAVKSIVGHTSAVYLRVAGANNSIVRDARVFLASPWSRRRLIMGPYSMNLRERVAAAIHEGEGSERQIAKRFRVSVSFVTRLLQRRRDAGTLAPKPHGGGPRPVLGFPEQVRLAMLIAEHPDATLKQLKEWGGFACTLTTLWRTLRRFRLTYKKKTLHAGERDTPEVQAKRRRYRAKVRRIEAKRLVFVDETGVNTAMTPTHAWARRGERAEGSVPSAWGSTTVIAALGLDGVRVQGHRVTFS